MHKTLLPFLITLNLGVYGLLLVESQSTVQIARVLGLMGLSLVWWQVMLGFRGTARVFTRDLISLNGIHKFMGTYGFFLLVGHYIFILDSDQYGLDIVLSLDIGSPTVLYITYGLIAFYSALTIWLTSALLRKRLPWDWWKSIHFLGYVVIGFAFLHSGNIGTILQTNDIVRSWWYVQLALFAAIVIWRFSNWIGLAKVAYTVEFVEDVAQDVKRFTLAPKQKALAIKPQKGQFAYFQYARFKRAHPFTVSHYSEETGAISFSIKKIGGYTKALHNELQRGDEVYIDGPYGVFTSEIEQTDRDAVLVAGGIGITPFLRRMDSKKVEHLFWGCQTTEDLAYRRDLINSKIDLTISLSSEEREGYETGFISVDLIRDKIEGELEEYDYYICGPPQMMEKLEKQLISAGVETENIHTERFSL